MELDESTSRFMLDALAQILFEERLKCEQADLHVVEFYSGTRSALYGICTNCRQTVQLARQGKLIGWILHEYRIEEWL